MKLLLIDPNVSLSSPSMKGIVRSLPALKAQGWEIEAWCWHCDDGLPIDRIDKLPTFGKLHTLDGYAFALWARLRLWWRFTMRRRPRPEVVYSVAWYAPQCDVAHVHFSPWDWERRQRDLGLASLRDVFERVTNLLSLHWANRFLRKTTARLVLIVSDAVANDVRAVRPDLHVRVLPNCYDPQRFHAGVRQQHRASMRQRLGFSQEDTVFVFVSAGHYRRKGFFLAVEAVAEPRARSAAAGARLLVVGGTERRLAALQAQLDTRCPDWRAFVTFTGMVPDVERYFAASDAFLFPSYSEAFALVEVEAAACGLPLFLTRHHGSEMILQDGVNGRYVEFEAPRIADVLEEFVCGQWTPQPGIHLHSALDAAAYGARFCEEIARVATMPVRSRTQKCPVPEPGIAHGPPV
ncbi:MAG: glycosyltransferase family 4 protein [Roseimicrobium sp.]